MIKLLFSVNTALLAFLIVHSFLFLHDSFKSRDTRSNKKLKKLLLSESKAPKSIDKLIDKGINNIKSIPPTHSLCAYNLHITPLI